MVYKSQGRKITVYRQTKRKNVESARYVVRASAITRVLYRTEGGGEYVRDGGRFRRVHNAPRGQYYFTDK